MFCSVTVFPVNMGEDSRLGSSSVVGIGGTSSSVPFKFLAGILLLDVFEFWGWGKLVNIVERKPGLEIFGGNHRKIL